MKKVQVKLLHKEGPWSQKLKLHLKQVLSSLNIDQKIRGSTPLYYNSSLHRVYNKNTSEENKY